MNMCKYVFFIVHTKSHTLHWYYSLCTEQRQAYSRIGFCSQTDVNTILFLTTFLNCCRLLIYLDIFLRVVDGDSGPPLLTKGTPESQQCED